jgi:hypothetical protein
MTTRGKRNNEAEKALYVRIREDLRTQFKAACKELSRPEADVVERLVGYFLSLERPERADLLGAKVVPSFSKLIQALEWANHAFSKQFWPWALEEYQRVEELAERANAAGIAWLSRYKQGFCWLDIAVFWRNKALQDPAQRQRHFDRATTATKNALYLNQKYLINHEHRVIFFNIGCAWSLLARLCVEEQMALIDPNIASTLLDDKKAWETVGTAWRKKISQKEFGTKIDSYGDRAMANLRTMALRQELLPRDISYLVSRWNSDPDLLFLRTDERFRDEFADFAQTNLALLPAGRAFEILSRDITDADRDSVFSWTSEGSGAHPPPAAA